MILYKIFKINKTKKQIQLSLLGVLFACTTFQGFAQKVSVTTDSIHIKIGAELKYQIDVEVDTSKLVVFPEEQTFLPLERINSYKIDTTRKGNRYQLLKTYGLTQFDSGAYTIPRQKVIIGSKTVLTDSLHVIVNEIAIDTTKQGLYDIKPIIEVSKQGSGRLALILGVLSVLALVGVLLYRLIWRKKPLTEEEKIALLPPYDRAKLALKQLDERDYLQNENLKEYYSELTLAIRRYLDEKVYGHALESTTDELVQRLSLLKEGNQIDLSKDTIKNIESVLKRADLVKFAKSAPDVELAKFDRNTVDVEIDHVKEVLPEPTEEEKLLNEAYKLEQEKKAKRKKILLTTVIAFGFLVLTLAGLSFKYGFSYVKDTILGHDSLELLEGEWVTSAYGIPPVTISTPKVLKRMELSAQSAKNKPEQQPEQLQTKVFSYGTLLDVFSVSVISQILPQAPPQQEEEQAQAPQIDLEQISEQTIKGFEAKGVKNIVVLRDKYTTPNGAEGLKTYGTAKIPTHADGSDFVSAKYTFLQFTAQNILQQIVITYPDNDEYAEQMITRILNSVELKSKEEK